MANKLNIHFTVLSLFFLSIFTSPVEARLNSKKHSLSQYHFSTPKGLKVQVDFWKKVYSRYTTDQAIVHDMKDLSIIYDVVDLSGMRSERSKERKKAKIKSKYKRILRNLAKNKPKAKLTLEEKRLARLVKNGYYRAARNIRIQIGQKDRFREGLMRSGRYMPKIEKLFNKYGLPKELTVLPHVESSFQLNAYSSAGAAGIWQFTRRTGRLFLKIGYQVDERMDPLLATNAAARLLKKNFEHLRSWPLAITAYNHGLQGMKRAKRIHGPDLVRIIDRYRSRTFGFASQNFYAEFLAALEVVRNYKKYFPGLKLDSPLKTVSLTFGHYIDVKTVLKYFNITKEEVNQYNYSLRKPVLLGQKRIPAGFVFKAPAKNFSNLEGLYSQIPRSLKHRSQIASKWYTVKRGDSISAIAARFRTSSLMLKRLNHVGRRNRIYVGQVLQLPQSRNRKSSRAIMARSKSINVTGLKTVSYEVRRNDNLSKIARRFNTEHEVLIALNRMSNPDFLSLGQIIKVPEIENIPSVRVFKKADKLVIKNKVKIAPKQFTNNIVSPNIKVNQPNISIKQFRPAFFPVVFSPTKHKDSKVGVVTVESGETLSHYADWAKLPVNELLRFNNLGSRKALKYQEKFKVPFYRTSVKKFRLRRQEFHKAIQEDFFNNYRVEKTSIRKIKKGETLWEISNQIYFIPFWLLSHYNPEQDIYALSVGNSIIIPLITKIKKS